MRVKIEQIAGIIEQIAEEEVMPRFRALAAHEVQEKDNGELVTSADLACEAALSARLRDLHPESIVIGEEAVAAEPALLETLSRDRPAWLIDPIDGTGNFAGGRPVFAIMLALVTGHATVAAWIYDPVNRRMALGESGSGAFMNAERLQVAKPRTFVDMHGTLHASGFAPPELAARVASRRERVRTLKSNRCAGWEYLRLISGEMHFTLFTRLMPWDHAPGILLHREAGGVANCFDGTAYNALRYREVGVLIAPDEDAWRYLYQTVVADD